MARPAKHPDDKRDQRFNLRFTLAEITQIQVEADKAGLGPHDYLRRRSLGHRVTTGNVSRADPALISELNRIGVNLNQLTRAVNSDRPIPGDWPLIALALKDALEKVMASDGAEAS